MASWQRLHESLPVGFLATETEEALQCAQMADELAVRLAEVESDLWENASSVKRQLDLVAVARSFVHHHRVVVEIQRRIHEGALALQSKQVRGASTLRRLNPLMDELDAAMLKIKGVDVTSAVVTTKTGSPSSKGFAKPVMSDSGKNKKRR